MIRQYEQSQLERLQAVELEIVDAIADVCSKHDIEWFLCFGSALGAVRDGAVIPWDDDMDIAMMREDYDRFLRVAPDALPPEYQLCIPEEIDGMAVMFAKVCKRNTRFYTQETIDAGFDQGIFVDIFVFDRLEPDMAARKAQVKKARRAKFLMYMYCSGNLVVARTGITGALEKIGLKVAHVLVHAFFNEKKLKRSFDAAARSASSKTGDDFATFAYSRGRPIPKDVLVPTSRAQLSGVTYPVPGKPEQYLEIYYGPDWNQVPPPEKRRNHAPDVLDFGDGINVLDV